MDTYEAKTARSLLKLLADNEPVPRAMIQTKFGLFLCGLLFIAVAAIYADGEPFGEGGSVLVFLGGALTGAGIYQTVANRQWPVLRKHLDRQSLESTAADAER